VTAQMECIGLAIKRKAAAELHLLFPKTPEETCLAVLTAHDFNEDAAVTQLLTMQGCASPARPAASAEDDTRPSLDARLSELADDNHATKYLEDSEDDDDGDDIERELERELKRCGTGRDWGPTTTSSSGVSSPGAPRLLEILDEIAEPGRRPSPTGSHLSPRAHAICGSPPPTKSSMKGTLDDAEVTCPICLDHITSKVTLQCGHQYCIPCLKAHATSALPSELREAARAAPPHVEYPEVGPCSCPCCKRGLPEADLRKIGLRSHGSRLVRPTLSNEADHRLSRRRAETRDHARRWTNELATRRVATRMAPHAMGATEDVRTLQQATRGLELRFCPGCSVPIQKNGGCDSVVCPCGHRFQWPTARPVNPCRRPHLDQHKWWGDSCPHCSRTARAKLVVRRAAVTTAAATPVAVLGAVGAAGAAATVAVGTAVAAVPAAIFGPLALAYEPVRRIRGVENNPFIMPAASGAGVVALSLYATCGGYESD